MNKTVKYVIGRLLFLIPIMLILSFFVVKSLAALVNEVGGVAA